MSGSAIPTGNVWPNYAKTNIDKTDKVTADKKSSLGKDDFLKILIAQLKNQDPMQPMQDKEFIAQMAQFTSVEQLTNMTNEMKLLRQSVGLTPALLGKEISWEAADSTGVIVTKKGVVDTLFMKNGVQYAGVGGDEISLDKLTKVRNPEGTS